MGITLWHVPISHYSEKARWALDLKRVPHTRRRLLGGTHPAATWLLTRGRHQTVPVLVVDGRGIGDSTAIIAELEERFPAVPLYPAEEAERRRALELEDWFDEEAGPYVRRLAYHDLIADPAALAELTFKQVPWVTARTRALAEPGLKAFLELRFRVTSDEWARDAEDRVVAAVERLEAELEGREFLCGDAISVADVTAASLLYPVVLPPEGPWVPRELPDAWARRRERLGDRPGCRWVERMYAQHRHAPR